MLNQDFKFHALVNNVLYECSAVRVIDADRRQALVTIKDHNPFPAYYFGAGCGNVNHGRVSINALRLVNHVTGQVIPVTDPVAHYVGMAIDLFAHTNTVAQEVTV